jgi:hypothetical protein
MTWFAVYTIADGSLVSVGTTLGTLSSGFSSTSLGANAPVGTWNTGTLAFDGVALKTVLRLGEFAKRFTQAERESLWNIQQNGTATQKQKLGAFKDYLQDAGFADLNDPYIQASVTLMETAGVIGAGRAVQILS